MGSFGSNMRPGAATVAKLADTTGKAESQQAIPASTIAASEQRPLSTHQSSSLSGPSSKSLRAWRRRCQITQLDTTREESPLAPDPCAGTRHPDRTPTVIATGAAAAMGTRTPLLPARLPPICHRVANPRRRPTATVLHRASSAVNPENGHPESPSGSPPSLSLSVCSEGFSPITLSGCSSATSEATVLTLPSFRPQVDDALPLPSTMPLTAQQVNPTAAGLQVATFHRYAPLVANAYSTPTKIVATAHSVILATAPRCQDGSVSGQSTGGTEARKDSTASTHSAYSRSQRSVQDGLAPPGCTKVVCLPPVLGGGGDTSSSDDQRTGHCASAPLSSSGESSGSADNGNRTSSTNSVTSQEVATNPLTTGRLHAICKVNVPATCGDLLPQAGCAGGEIIVSTPRGGPHPLPTAALSPQRECEILPQDDHVVVAEPEGACLRETRPSKVLGLPLTTLGVDGCVGGTVEEEAWSTLSLNASPLMGHSIAHSGSPHNFNHSSISKSSAATWAMLCAAVTLPPLRGAPLRPTGASPRTTNSLSYGSAQGSGNAVQAESTAPASAASTLSPHHGQWFSVKFTWNANDEYTHDEVAPAQQPLHT